jgi:hypothetical protein
VYASHSNLSSEHGSITVVFMPDMGHPCSTRVQDLVAPKVAVIILWLHSGDIDVAISIEAPRATESRAEKI